jgi:hypothetical protein
LTATSTMSCAMAPADIARPRARVIRDFFMMISFDEGG